MFYGFLWGFTGFYWVSLVTGTDIWPRCCSFSFIGRGGWSWRVERFLFFFIFFPWNFLWRISSLRVVSSVVDEMFRHLFFSFFSFFSFCFYFWKGGHTRSSFFFFGLLEHFFESIRFVQRPFQWRKSSIVCLWFRYRVSFLWFQNKKRTQTFLVAETLWPSAFDGRFRIQIFSFTQIYFLLGNSSTLSLFFCCVPFFPVPSQRPIDEYFCFLFFFVLKEKKTLAPLPIGEPVVDTVGGACKNKTKTNEIRCQNHSTTTHSSRAK